MQVAQRTYPLTTRESGEIIARDSSGEISLGQFLAHVSALSRQLPERQYVINLAANRYRFLVGFCAAIVAGQCTLNPPNRQRRTLQQIADEYGDCYTFGEVGLAGVERFDSTFADIDPHADNLPVPEIPAGQLCAVVFTSGSTGKPTPTHKFWETLRVGSLSNIDLLVEDRAAPTSLLATVPAQHMWGLEMSILLPLFCNVAVSYQSPLFPQDIADALESLPEPRALVSSPAHLDAFLRANTGRVRIDRIFSATAPMSRQLAQQLEERFDARVVEVFGCSESGIIAGRYAATETLWRLGSIFELEAGQNGFVIKASHLPEEVALNDVIELVGDGHFRWLGRHQDMVNIAGKRGSLADLNQRLNSIPGVIDGVIFLPDDSARRLAALVVAPGLKPSDVLDSLRPGVEPAFLPRPVYMVPTLPRQETGKLARTAVAELFADLQAQRTL